MSTDVAGVIEPGSGSGPNLTVASAVVRVSDLRRSVGFYCYVFGFHIAVSEHDMALLVAPSGFQLYLNSIDPSRRHDRGTIGVEFLMWATDSQGELDKIAERLRNYDSAVFVHTENGVTFVEGVDPDRLRMVVAYPSPDRLPREVIASVLRG
ncbi:MAG TPA: VOC family protein [Mycobacterium sp.]|nr:VOC family protein [Mycobacterium sp.]